MTKYKLIIKNLVYALICTSLSLNTVFSMAPELKRQRVGGGDELGEVTPVGHPVAGEGVVGGVFGSDAEEEVEEPEAVVAPVAVHAPISWPLGATEEWKKSAERVAASWDITVQVLLEEAEVFLREHNEEYRQRRDLREIKFLDKPFNADEETSKFSFKSRRW
jgi:hypothetical protein